MHKLAKVPTLHDIKRLLRRSKTCKANVWNSFFIYLQIMFQVSVNGNGFVRDIKQEYATSVLEWHTAQCIVGNVVQPFLCTWSESDLPSWSVSRSPKHVSLALNSDAVIKPCFLVSINLTACRISARGFSCWICTCITLRNVEKSNSPLLSGTSRVKALCQKASDTEPVWSRLTGWELYLLQRVYT